MEGSLAVPLGEINDDSLKACKSWRTILRSELSTEGKGGSNISDPLALFSRQGGCYLRRMC